MNGDHCVQVTLCSFIPVIPGYRDVCNLTSDNRGLPWYCGRPTAPGLECKHWTWSARTEFPQTYPVSDVENALIRRFDTVCVLYFPLTVYSADGFSCLCLFVCLFLSYLLTFFLSFFAYLLCLFACLLVSLLDCLFACVTAHGDEWER